MIRRATTLVVGSTATAACFLISVACATPLLGPSTAWLRDPFRLSVGFGAALVLLFVRLVMQRIAESQGTCGWSSSTWS